MRYRISKTKLAVTMIKKDYTFTKLAELTGISRVTLSYINNGKTCRTAVLSKIAEALMLVLAT